MDTNQLSSARTAFKRAVFMLGGQARMAKLLGISQQAVSHRLIRTSAPVRTSEEIDKIEAATGVSRHELRPDLYPRETPAPAISSPLAQHPAGQPPASAPQSPPQGDEAGGSTPGDPLQGIAA